LKRLSKRPSLKRKIKNKIGSKEQNKKEQALSLLLFIDFCLPYEPTIIIFARASATSSQLSKQSSKRS